MTCLSPKDKMHYENWKKAKECFEKGFLPCYFLQPTANKEKLPTLIVVTGGEGTAMEMYFWCAPEGLRRGYNVLLCELPGNISTVYLSSELTLRADTEVPMKQVMDYLYTRPEVDIEKIALIGYSAGGYFAARAAAYEKRIKALITDSPLRDIYIMFTAVFPKILLSRKTSSLLAFIIEHFTSKSDKVTIDLLLWESGIEVFADFIELVKQVNLEGIEKDIICPTLALASEGEGQTFLNQAKLFFDNISSTKKKMKIFTKKEGASAHCQIDNISLASKTIYDWLDEIL
ncbi:MAG TPA: alpha/beta fold hydrolase [Ruminiclostridium sp.]